ncbi:phage integrase N-terminal SAM-like domain-containing protein [Tessaracoccus coleopterorum]|uniref:phage integrase N-terminal SAM-like domain-containing protein n=1 Tax=Tessaracoccus coleopterorum TaxID=2714950 RepID=UPI0018D3B186|nr:phage integrase N-terminal SAM-like domain-containing protein [Tessaracoccus coleopterorum]
MHVDGVGRVSVVPSLPVLRPEEQVLQLMLDGWRNQQLSRNLQFATIEQRLRCVRRFVEHMNEDPWNWTPAMVEEFSADLRTVRHVSRSTLRSYHSALRAFTSYVSNPTTDGTGSASSTSAPTRRRSSSTGTPHRTSRSTTADPRSVPTRGPSSIDSSSTPTMRSNAWGGRDARAGRRPIAMRS